MIRHRDIKTLFSARAPVRETDAGRLADAYLRIVVRGNRRGDRDPLADELRDDEPVAMIDVDGGRSIPARVIAAMVLHYVAARPTPPISGPEWRAWFLVDRVWRQT